jgi:hypothetical protein
MKFLRKVFGTQPTADKQSDEEPEESTVSDSMPKQVQGVLILTRQPLSDSHKLLEQIILHQRSRGYAIAWDIISRAAVSQNVDDKAFLEATIRKQFVKLSSDDLMDRTEVIPCQDSVGNSGVYCIIFNRP